MTVGPGTQSWDYYASKIGENLTGALERYLMEGIPPGDFLLAVLANDLFEAIGRADEHSHRVLQDICGMIYNCFPTRDYGGWGNRNAVVAWIEHGGARKISTTEPDQQTPTQPHSADPETTDEKSREA